MGFIKSIEEISENLQKKGEEAIYSVADVVEKPSIEYCEELIKTGIYFCHTGMCTRKW